ncbi:hypothetical protein HK100_001705 [Physocladia obscura]|uniref:Uncharacterized protein n=1 Tax=Physocladia obscura TaxID=109957 RepID=A0AAD5SZG4_9FUNG|nr:hypothetical protein HK100_001705 [Physocladia obscura]
MNDTKASLCRSFPGIYYPSPPFSEPITFSVFTPSMQQYLHHTDTNTHHRELPTPAQPEHGCETYFGFIKDRHDAMLVVEACVQGRLKCIPVYKYTNFNFRSGSIVVISQKAYSITSSIRWRDGRHWTISRLNEGFLLYRETESLPKGFSSPRFPIEAFSYFAAGTLKPNTQLIPDGMAKRTISLTGSDGNWYRVISYFYASDVESHYKTMPQRQSFLKTPSEIPELAVFGREMRAEDLSSFREIVTATTMAKVSRPPLQFKSTSGCSCGGIKRLGSVLQSDLRDREAWFEQPMHLTPINKTQREEIN